LIDGPTAPTWAGRVVLLVNNLGGTPTVHAVNGIALGLISGYVGGWADTIIMRCNDALMSFPALILAVVIVGLLGPSLPNAMTAIGLVYAPRIMRVVRGSTLSVREEVYMMAARATGCSVTRIITRHVLPNVTGPLVVQATVLMGQALLAEAGLSFLGLGAQPPEASWGAMLGTAFPYLAQAPVPTIAAGTIISVTAWHDNTVGNKNNPDPTQWVGGGDRSLCGGVAGVLRCRGCGDGAVDRDRELPMDDCVLRHNRTLACVEAQSHRPKLAPQGAERGRC
jgi:ABC-type dipeptide/oligopeptide/nickel transport system permease subunit